MKILKTIGRIFGAALKLTATQKAVAALKETAVGAAVRNDVVAIRDENLSGTEKFERVLVNTVPLLLTLLKSEQRDVVFKDVEDIGRALVQEIYNDVVSPKAGGVAALVLKILGVK